MATNDRNFTRIQAKLALDQWNARLAKRQIVLFSLILNHRDFRRLIVLALQAETFNGEAYWPHPAIMEEAIDEWLQEYPR